MEAIITQQAELVAGGQAALVVCAVLYLVWWCTFFNPRTDKPHRAKRIVGIVSIVSATVLGVAGIVLVVTGLGGLAGTGINVHAVAPLGAFIVGGVVAYVVLLLATVKLFARQVTTELILFVAWAALEFAVVSELFGIGILGSVAAPALAVLVAVVAAITLVCYVRYYRLPPWPSFIDGIVPLAAVGVVCAIMATAIVLA